MKRLRLMAEAQPTDPVLPSVLFIDSRESETRPSTARATSLRVPTTSKHPHGNVRDVNMVVLHARWTIEDLSKEIELNALAAAEAAGLEIDLAELRRRALATARRELGLLRRMRRWFE